jgi:hypothetical protein
MNAANLPMPARIARLERAMLPVAAAGLFLLAIGYLMNPAQFFRSYLFAYVFWAGVAVGCLSISMISHLTGGLWGLLIRRFLEAGTRTFPVLTLLFLPVAFGVGTIYSWTHPGHDPVLLEKAIYLNVPFFLVRAAFYFAAWILLAHFLNKWSLALDAGVSRRISRRLEALAGGGLLVLGLTITLSAIDWGMSLAPHWFSTIYGVLFMVGQVLSAMALMIVLVAILAEERPIAEAIRPRTIQDLGKLLLAFTMLWAYLNLSQFLIVWSGNLSEETPFYLQRLQGGWQYVSFVLLLFHFVIPFLLLLSRDLKRNPRRLGMLAAGMFLIRLLDLYWLLAPDLLGHGHETVPFTLHWLDLVAPVGIGAAWLYFFLGQLRNRPILPMGEPEVMELLETRSGAHA